MPNGMHIKNSNKTKWETRNKKSVDSQAKFINDKLGFGVFYMLNLTLMPHVSQITLMHYFQQNMGKKYKLYIFLGKRKGKR